MRIFQGIKGLLLTAAAGAAAIVILSVIFGLVIYRFFDDLSFSGLFSAAACAAGCFSGAYFGGRYRRRRGLIDGIICGLLIYTLFTAASLITAGSPTGIKKLLLLVISGGAGGVAGVNTKRPRRLM